MEKYHKEGGFFDLLNRFSCWVDGWIDYLEWHLDGYLWVRFLQGEKNKRLYEICYAIMNEEENIKIFIAEPVGVNNDIWISSSEASLEKLKSIFNSEKYWWMAEK